MVFKKVEMLLEYTEWVFPLNTLFLITRYFKSTKTENNRSNRVVFLEAPRSGN